MERTLKERAKEILENAACEIIAEGAWSGHCYCFEYMQDPAKAVASIMEETGELDRLDHAFMDTLVQGVRDAAEFFGITELAC